MLQYHKATYYCGHQWKIQGLQTALRFGRPAPLLVWGQEQIIAEVFPAVLEELAKQRLLFFQSQFLPVQWYLCLQGAAMRKKTITNLDQRKKPLKHCAVKHKNSLRIGKKGDTQKAKKNKGPKQRISEHLCSIFRAQLHLYNITVSILFYSLVKLLPIYKFSYKL